ncbi:helix-turn-helix domain-containing protein [Mucisphaera sp.]|uniref:helix-turn-helix domain-containing protein n=1 Tax=Mucisphaera sp. TaxID=2913024 RepID=UPI003D0D2734
MKQSLSPKELAQAIGVSESSLKRWTDSGRVKASRTVGGHRRINVQEAIRFIRESSLPLVRPEILGLPDLNGDELTRDVSGAAGTLARLLREGDLPRSQALVLNLYLSGHSVAWICDGPLSHAMCEIGELWVKDAPDGVFSEHRATEMATQIMNQLRMLLEPGMDMDLPERPKAVGGCPMGDHGALASVMVAGTLAEAGYEAVNLGGDTPVDALCEAIGEYSPLLVYLTCPHPGNLPKTSELERISSQAVKTGGCLVLGGLGAEEAFRPLLPNIFMHHSMSELSAFARGLLAQREPKVEVQTKPMAPAKQAAMNGHALNGHSVNGHSANDKR